MPASDMDELEFADLRAHVIDVGRGSEILGCGFRSVVAEEFVIANSRIVECRFSGLGVPMVKMARSVLRNVEFVDSRLGAVEAYDTDVAGLEFRGCRIEYLNLRDAKLTDVKFTDCIIEELDLTQASGRRIGFSGSRVSTLVARNSKLSDLDLRGTDLATITGWSSLRGAFVTTEQLMALTPSFAAEVGLVLG